jgi:SRSO17 transposase
VKQPQHITFVGLKTSATHVASWAYELTHLHRRLAPRFARPEPRRRALAYLQGLLSATERKNGWQLAEQAREATPYGMQRLLSQAVWDTDGVRDDLRAYVLEQLGTQGAIIAIDETSFPKRGKHSAGVGVQYGGTTGQVENCQVGVFLSYVTSRGHSLIDRELYLPLEWLQDHERCREVGIPESVRFQTKPELAVQMLARLQQAQVPIAWVVADTVYGGNLDLRTWCEQQQYPYVLAVPCDEPVGIVTPDGHSRRVLVSEVEALRLPEQDWQRLSMSEGTKGPRLFDWAAVPILHKWQDEGRHWLLLRRCLSAEQQKTYYLVSAAPGTTLLQEMVQAGGARWHIEEDFENDKDLGSGSLRSAQLPGLVSPHDPGHAGAGLPDWYLHPAAGAGCPDRRPRHLPDHSAAFPDDPGSAPCVGTADLAASQQCPAGAGLVLVAALSPQLCLLFSHQAAAGSRLSAPGMDSLFSLYCLCILPVVRANSRPLVCRTAGAMDAPRQRRSHEVSFSTGLL